MKSVLCAIIGLAILAVGCQTTDSGTKTAKEKSVIGQPVAAVVKAHAGQRMEFFDKTGKPLNELPRGESGSVSIHNKDQTGQDNYAFDSNGIIVKHKRSYGEDYTRGVWKDVK